MLKYFGMREILYGFKRFAAVIVAVTVAFAAIGYLVGQSKEVDSNATEVYYSSASYLATAKLKESEQSQADNDKAVANTVSSMLTSDFAKQYVLDKILKEYSVEDVLKYTGKRVSGGEIDYTVLNDAIVSTVLPNTPIINFYVMSQSEEFSKNVVQFFEDYLKSEAGSKVSQLDSLEYLGSTTVTENNFNNGASSSPLKKAVIIAIIGFMLSACAVLLFVLIKPTISSKDAYSEYGVFVLDDKAEHASQDYAYAVDSVKSAVAKTEIASVAAVCTLNSKLFNKKFAALVQKLQSAEDAKCSFSKASGIIKNFAELEKVKNCDAVVLIERKGRTYHSDFKNTVAILEKYDIPVVGVVLI